jgi:O-Antigen ligase
LNSHIALNSQQGLAQRFADAMAPAQAAPAPPDARSDAVPQRLTLSGMVLFVTCSLMFASGFKALRPEIGGLLVHPFLIPLAIVSPFLLVGRLKAFPPRLLAALLMFLGLYALATLGGGIKGMASEVIKVCTTGAAMGCTALLVRSRSDFIAGVLGLSAAAGLMGIYGIGATVNSATGVEALDVGNKNAFSLFALPAMLLGGYLILDMPVRSRALRVALKLAMTITTGACALAIFLSGNRSGYLGCVVIAAMLLRERRLYGMLLVGMVAAMLLYVMMHFEMTSVFEHRWKQTFVEKNESDILRGHILKACFQIGLEYPLAGVSATRLPFVIGMRVGAEHAGFNVIESHNIFAHIWASSGLICFSALWYIAWAMWFLPAPRDKEDKPLQSEFRQAHRLLKMMVLLWIMRGLFTSAILYNPGFSMGMGLAIGYCMLLMATPKRGAQRAGQPALPGRLAVQP